MERDLKHALVIVAVTYAVIFAYGLTAIAS